MSLGHEIADDATPCVRLFVSVDLSGSTHLKNVLNQQQLLSRYRSAIGVIEALRRNSEVAGLEPTVAERAALDSLEVGTVDFDWSTVIQTFYDDFHSEFRTQVAVIVAELQMPAGFEVSVEPWKAVGDELIYVFEVWSRRQAHWLVIAFLATMRTIDKKLITKDRGMPRHGLRLKGSAWIAGFPVRNRRVKLPGPITTYDYLGPEVDTGFRLGKCTQPGMLAVSVELAELLAEVPTALRPLTGMIVRWERLKGVWEDRHYPVVWVDMPSGHLPELAAEGFDDWELQESGFSKQWDSKPNPKPNLTELCLHLREIRNRLPATLGIVDAYIVADADVPDEVPTPHREIQQLQALVATSQKLASRQDVDEQFAEPGGDDTEPSPQQVIDDALSPPPEQKDFPEKHD
jgi:hypothetical protein